MARGRGGGGDTKCPRGGKRGVAAVGARAVAATITTILLMLPFSSSAYMLFVRKGRIIRRQKREAAVGNLNDAEPRVARRLALGLIACSKLRSILK